MRIDKNFVAVVTGGTSGLGRSTVKLLTSLGAKVVIAGTSEAKGKEVEA
jgi:NAD(P)-dependent dehydrogenase (short-subunit alcohol dehydrogenase family)